MKLRAVLLFSGKRKSGKDFITNKLVDTCPDEYEILKISYPIKHHFAKEKDLNMDQLLSSDEYKEVYRKEMIKWSEEMREKDYGCFCRAACDAAQDKRIWIVSDIRRKTDIEWFKEHFGNKVCTIRIVCDEPTRVDRGYVFTAGVDDVASECDLDDYGKWDLIVDNGCNRKDWSSLMDSISKLMDSLA